MTEDVSGRPDREDMRREWAARAPFWIGRAADIADMAEKFNVPLLEAAKIAPARAVLDLASGAGEPALSIIRHTAPGTLVVASDLVPDMLAGVSARCLETLGRRLPMAASDMQALPFRDAAFDRVVCRFGLMFVPDPGAAFAEVARVLAPGGRTAFLVWGPLAHNSLFAVLHDVGRQVLGAAAAENFLTMNRFADSGSVADLMAGAGLVGAEERELDLIRQVPAAAPFWQAPLDMAFGHQFESAGTDARAAFEAALPAAFAPFRDGDAYAFRVHVRIATADAAA